jgi:tetratricopeptide (TPR) repeat protein
VRVDWRGRYERAAARYAAGETRELDERQLVQLANSAWAAGLSLLMAGEREEAAEWLRRSAARYRESWEAGDGTDAWGRPIGAMKALLIAGDDASDAARWTLETCLGVRHLDMSVSPIGRYAGVLALLVLERYEEAAALTETLGDGFPSGVADALAALAARDADGYGEAVAAIRRDFETREDFLEDVPVPDTVLALDVLAARRFT